MKLALFGATGKTGRLILKQAILAGHEVSVLARDPAKVGERSERVHVFAGDVRDSGAVAGCIEGADAVISALASGQDLLTTFGRNVVPAMEQQGITRIVSLTGASLRRPGDPRSVNLFMLRTITHTIARDSLKDGEAHARELEDSSLTYTLVRPPRLTDGIATGRVVHGTALSLGPFSSISRADLAIFMLTVALVGLYPRAAPMVASNR